MPSPLKNITTFFILRISTIKDAQTRNTTKVIVSPSSSIFDSHSFVFNNLVGNTTYRVSVEAFSNFSEYNETRSIWYVSKLIHTTLALLKWLPPPVELNVNERGEDFLDFQWSLATVAITSYETMINQHELTIYEFNPIKKSSIKLRTMSIRLPSTRIIIDRLNPSTIYNITIRTGTDYGYGYGAWGLFATSDKFIEDVLRLKERTPNSLIVTWNKNWMPQGESKNRRFTVKAVTIHSMFGSNKELSISNVFDGNKQPEVVLKGLSPGTTFNVTLYARIDPKPIPSHGGRGEIIKFKKNIEYKKTWNLFSTLPQGAYLVADPRIAAETETAASLVWHPIEHIDIVEYQLRYFLIEAKESSMIVTPPFSEKEVLCPKYGCDWLCYLIFNLKKHPRHYEFHIRARIDNIWNKWIVVSRKTWNLMERVCSITPPNFIVENTDSVDYMREIDIEEKEFRRVGTWRYLLIVDKRNNDGIASIDMTHLSDLPTAKHDDVPYYIAASLTEENFKKMKKFIIGDGKQYGGYMNYPLDDRDLDPFWTIMPISQTENEVMEPKLKSCGINEKGIVECEMTLIEMVGIIPTWLVITGAIIILFFIFIIFFTIWRCTRKTVKTKTVSEDTYKRTPSISFSRTQSIHNLPRTLRSRTQSFNNVEYTAIRDTSDIDSILNFEQIEENFIFYPKK
uniref:Fibronectin type-III domain-containing protein n=1 Tax=Parastrongyloides trichosuri TaxID=131310 RepID=A0A0N4Z453_PARTI